MSEYINTILPEQVGDKKTPMCMQVQTYTHKRACTHSHMRACTHTHAHRQTDTCTLMNMHAHIAFMYLA